ncbi:CRISPR system Cascade subunit CasE [Sphingomonas palmae]|uniref:CRISPR system Cascade subunit CasE n=1 Tax=Sphingomonas palmae TaxID=1855283 RepID=A0A1H7UM23_9SPHN|nr:type I-E CRISPR-associated protein Cas6/Cse3/CasE [Sphingomonas palmae]SEL97688.1 CRISPR system Cascade subunit CasE [Sphingomonas palmae]
MTLHLLRIGIDRHALQRFAVERRLDDDDAGYALHAALAARFGAAAPRPFRFLPDHPRGAHLLGYVADAAALGDAAALPPADEGIAAIFPGDHQLQPMPDAWREGARYAFEVRVRPVVRFGKQARAARSERGGWQPRAGEIDAFVAACERAVATDRGAGGAPDSDSESLNIGGVSREAVYADWLAARLNGAATIEHAALRDFRRARTRRNTHAGKSNTGGQPRTRAVEGPDAVMAGTLAVADAAAFAALLAGGVGRHAAFGFGMLLLAPPGRAG